MFLETPFFEVYIYAINNKLIFPCLNIYYNFINNDLGSFKLIIHAGNTVICLLPLILRDNLFGDEKIVFLLYYY